MIFLQSCVFPSASKNLDSRDVDIYNRIGFTAGNTPVDIQNNNDRAKRVNSGVRVVDDYYYRGPEPKKIRPKKRSSKRVLRVNYVPSSRYYNNPYSFKPPAQFPYFDSDQYYTPPQASRGVENQNNLNNNKLY